MRSILCVLMLAFCLIARECTADGGSAKELGQREAGAQAASAAPQSSPQGENEKQNPPHSEDELESEDEVEEEDEEDDSDRKTEGKPQAKVIPPPVGATVTTTTITTVKTDEVPGTINNDLPQPEKQEQDSSHPSHGAKHPHAPKQPSSQSKPEENAHAQPPPKVTPKKTVLASGSEEQNSLHTDEKTLTGEVQKPSGQKITAGQGQSTAVKDQDAPQKDLKDKDEGLHTHKVNNPPADITKTTPTTTTAQATEKKNDNGEETITTTVLPTTATSSVPSATLQKSSNLPQSAAKNDGSSKSTSLLVTLTILVTIAGLPVTSAC